MSISSIADIISYPWLDGAAEFIRTNHQKPSKTVTVAIVDTGFDTTCVAISRHLWKNAGEIAGDGVDNDENGFADDMCGWNFLGNAAGKDVISAGTAEYREYKRLRPVYADADTLSFSEAQKSEYKHFTEMENAAKIPSLYKYRDMLVLQLDQMKNADDTTGMGPYIGYMESRYEEVSHNIAQLDIDDDVHHGLGHDPDDFSDLHYGNDHIGVDDYHGTMVAGLIALTAEQCGADVRLMLLRAVPGRGDEFDRDVAASIMYAVDNGADIINLSLGKKFSPHPEKVSAAIRYAAENDVLIVQAAGNSGSDNDIEISYPSHFDTDGTRFTNMLVVGSFDKKGEKASFSNYGRRTVDIFAPGVNISSTAPGGTMDSENGTSLSSPAVAGIAAVMKSFKPSLSAARIAGILKGTAEGGNVDALAAFKSAISPFVDWVQVERFTSDSLSRLAENTYVSVKWEKIKNRDIAFWDDFYFIPKVHRSPMKMYDRDRLFKQLQAVDSVKASSTDAAAFRIWPEFETEDIISFTWGDKTVRYNIPKAKLLSSEPVKRNRASYSGSDYWKKWSADSSCYVYALNHDLYFAYKDGREDVKLTSDGELYHSFSSSGNRPGNNEEKPSYASGSWISGTHSYFVLREDTRKVGTLSVVNSLAEPRPVTQTYKYTMSGDKDVPQYDCWIADADAGRIVKVATEKWKDQKLLVPRFRGVNTTSDAAWVLRVNRTLDSLELCRIDAHSGDLKVVISEECKPHYNDILFDYHLINDGKEILWWSEREGKGAWYLYGGDGQLKNKISGGDFVAGAIHKIDTVGRSIIFCGYGYRKDVNPEYDFYFKADLAGRKTVCLTPENGQHSIDISKSGKYIFDTYSRVDAGPRTLIYDDSGKQLAVVNESDLSKVREYGWKEPEIVKVKAADGVTDLWGIVYLPAVIEPGRKYPVISHVYPGPQTDLLPKSFVFDDDGNHSMAQMGCVVINFMHRGCNPWMGKEFYDYSYGNLRDYPIDDDKAIIEQLAEKYGFLDLDRVGIFGHSGGGFMSATALMKYPDFYKVAVAVSGNYDNNIYSILWGEVYHGVKENENGEFVSEIPVTQELAANLKGKLLLVTGDVDTNVHPASTYRLASELIKKGKTFDMLVLPGSGHDVGGDYYDNVIRYYFLEHLLGVRTDDIDIVNHR